MSTSQSLPLYQCHKQVRAVKIKEVLKHAHPDPKADDAAFESSPAFQGAHLIPIDERLLPIAVDEDWYRKHSPQSGGYYVVYEDGYTSYSPAAAFESGYSPVLAMAQQNSRIESAGAMVGASASISGQQRISHREELERLLVSGASAQVAHEPNKAAAIAKGIKTVLDELAPVAPHPVALTAPPVSVLTPFASRIGRGGLNVQARDTQAAAALSSNSQGCQDTLNLPVIDQGHNSLERCIQNNNDERTTKTGMDLAAHDAVTGLALRGIKEISPTDSHASAVLYPAIKRAMDDLDLDPLSCSVNVNRAYNDLFDAFWSETPAPASEVAKRRYVVRPRT